MVDTELGSVRLRAVGTGRITVVLACDAPIAIEHYDALIALLRLEFRVLCLEMPGFGMSRPSAAFDFGLTCQAELVRQVLQAENVDECVLAFSCVSAYVAIRVAHELPSIVRGVVLIQAPSWEQEQRWAQRIDFRGRGVLAMPYVGQLAVQFARRPMAKRWFEKALGRKELSSHFVQLNRAAFDAGAVWALASLTQALFQQPAPALPTLSQKGLVVWGQRDRTHRHSDPRSSLTYLTRGELVLFEHAGHFPDVEEPARFAALLRDFCA